MNGVINCGAAVETLQKVGINFVAIDFDLTMVDQHTRGQWAGTAEQLAPFVRPVFRNLLPVLFASGLCIAIVTFSGQRELIEKVLQITFPQYASQIVIRARDKSWGHPGGSRDGKQRFMASAAEQLERDFGREITRSSTLLIDDDRENIKIALENGVRALWFIPEEPDGIIAQMENLE